MAIAVNRLTNANVYLNGNNMAGKASEIDLPVVAQRMAEHNALGMSALMELPAGFDKMEARIKWNSFYPDAFGEMADPFKVHAIQCRSSLENYTSAGRTAETPYVVFMRGTFKSVPPGQFKQHENVEMESTVNVLYIRVEANGQTIMELDALANIYKVNGVDLLSTYRANLGL